MTASGDSGTRDASSLSGRRVAVTRPVGTWPASDALVDGLRERGAEVIHCPLVRIARPEDDGALGQCVARLERYDWAIFTSANAVRAVAAHLGQRPARPECRVAVVGPATALSVERLLGWSVTVMPEEYRGGAVVEAMEAVGPIEGLRVLWPRARTVSTDLTPELQALGAMVDAPVAYSTDPEPGAAHELHRMMHEGDLDAITLTSPSAVRSLSVAGQLPPGLTLAVIGPSTAAAARRCGMRVDVQPGDHTIAALVDALAHYYADARHD